MTTEWRYYLTVVGQEFEVTEEEFYKHASPIARQEDWHEFTKYKGPINGGRKVPVTP